MKATGGRWPSTGATLWSQQKYGTDGSTYGGATASALALSPDGTVAYVTGYEREATGERYLTTGYSTATGAATFTAH
ncbi:MAG TPA: hypothetical protein VHY58_22065 [Streptosporangiaceae bacterium]|jgi:hypothetical protein|nr:hypothetical protein [Streptosporangiaceae bacterium]